MYRRKDKSGKRTGPWYITVAGIRQTSGTTDRERAKRLETKLNQEAWDREHGLVVPTWASASISWSKANPKAAGTAANVHFAKWWREHLRDKKLREIDADLIHRAISSERKVDLNNRIPENCTANHYVGFVRMVMKHSNVIPKFIVYPQIKFRERHLTPDEWVKLQAHLSPDELDVFQFALATGLREANVISFEPGWVHGTSAEIPAIETKTSVPYGIPLNMTAQAILKRRQEATVRPLQSALNVFTYRGAKWYTVKLLRSLKRACKAAGIPYITFHGLRHTFITWLAKSGVPKEIRMRLAGHTTSDAHDGYTHWDVEALRPYSERIDAMFSGESKKQEVA